MVRFRFAVALLVLTVGGLASAADSPLSAFSDDTDVVVRIKAPKATVDKAASLVEAVQPDSARWCARMRSRSAP